MKRYFLFGHSLRSEQALLARLEAGYALKHAGTAERGLIASLSLVLNPILTYIMRSIFLGALLVNQGKPIEAATLANSSRASPMMKSLQIWARTERFPVTSWC